MSSTLDANISAAPVRHDQPDGGILYRLPSARSSASSLAPMLLFFALLLPLFVSWLLVPRQELRLVVIAAIIVLPITLVVFLLWLLLTQLKPLLAPREVHLGKSELVAISRIGPFSWQQRRSLARIELVVIRAKVGRQAELEIVSHGAAPLRLSRPLPLEQLRPFAHELADELTRRDPSATAPVTVREDIAAAVGEYGQPAGSSIIAVEQGGTLFLTIPPLRPRSGRILGLTVGGVAYLVGSVAHTLQVLWPFITTLSPTSVKWDEMPSLFFSWLAGAAFVVGALYHGSRRMTIAVSPQGLRIEVASLFRQTRWHWSRAQIGKIIGDERGFYIQPVPGKQVRFHWLGTGPAEYRWLAAAVTRALEQSAAQTDSVPAPANPLPDREDEE
jgi:hypothetical protein